MQVTGEVSRNDEEISSEYVETRKIGGITCKQAIWWTCVFVITDFMFEFLYLSASIMNPHFDWYYCFVYGLFVIMMFWSAFYCLNFQLGNENP